MRTTLTDHFYEGIQFPGVNESILTELRQQRCCVYPERWAITVAQYRYSTAQRT